MSNFWQKLKPPIFVMAPMANVTDAVFRSLFAKYGSPDVFWTEFVSVEGLLSKGRDKLLIDLQKSDKERPIVAQLFGSKPHQFEEVSHLIKSLGFDGIDINMGCPDTGVERSGAGANLIKNPSLAKEIIKSASVSGLPVSVKTRLGYDSFEMDTWLKSILECKPVALTIHFRTRKEMSDVPAHWELAKDIKKLRDDISLSTILLGNGDIESLEDARSKVLESGFDGAMIGRGLFGSPWFFSEVVPSLKKRLEICIEHTELFESTYKSHLTKKEGKLKNFETMKKHFKAYISNFDGSKELRLALMETKLSKEVKNIIKKFIVDKNL